MAPGRAIDETDAIRIDALFVAIIVITLLFEKLTHFLEHSLKGKTRRGFRHAIHYIEEELLALGLISLLLIVTEEYLLKLCVDADDDYGSYGSDYGSSDSYGSDSSDSYGEEGGDGYRRFSRKLLAGYGDSCPEGEEPFWSANTLHQTHLFIFMVAVTHVLYATASVIICLLRMRRWKQFEQRPNHELKMLKNTNLVYGKNSFEYWFWSFWAQFSPSVDESLYLSMRCLFIERMEFPDDFDFLSFVVNTLVEEFAVVVRTDWLMWAIAAIWILVPAFLTVTTISAVLIVLLAGTKLEVVGVKLTQLAFLSYGNRGNALLQPIKAPNNLIQRSVRSVARRMSHLALLDHQDEQPRLASKSLSSKSLNVRAKHERQASSGSADMRRVQSFEMDNNLMIGPGAKATSDGMVTPADQSVRGDDRASVVKSDETSESKSLLAWFGSFRRRQKAKNTTFSAKYNLPDSAHLFWFQQPQLILKALRFVYFETSMAIAVVLFDTWQETDNFIIEDIDYFHSQGVTVGALIAVGVLCLLHTSFLMLPTYALTMVAGSHCPERVLRVAKKMDIETSQVARIESLREKDIYTQINALPQQSVEPVKTNKKQKQKELVLYDDHNEKAITSLVGAMYRGRLQRLMRNTSADSQQIFGYLHNAPGSSKSFESPFGDPEALAVTDRAGQSSQSNSGLDDEEMKGIEAIFGSFERFLEHLAQAQESVRQMSPNAVFNFDVATGSYNGNESTSFDRAAVNLTWDLVVAKQNAPNDDNA